MIALLALVANGCGSEARTSSPSTTTSTSAPSTRPATTTITIENFAFGKPVTVEVGAMVTVHNADDTAHTVTAADASFDTMPVFAGTSTTFAAPAKAGSYAFHCSIHANMQGTLVVGG